MPPVDVYVDSLDHDLLEVCWTHPPAAARVAGQQTAAHITNYTIFYKEIPQFPFLGGLGLVARTSEYISRCILMNMVNCCRGMPFLPNLNSPKDDNIGTWGDVDSPLPVPG